MRTLIFFAEIGGFCIAGLMFGVTSTLIAPKRGASAHRSCCFAGVRRAASLRVHRRVLCASLSPGSIDRCRCSRSLRLARPKHCVPFGAPHNVGKGALRLQHIANACQESISIVLAVIEKAGHRPVQRGQRWSCPALSYQVLVNGE